MKRRMILGLTMLCSVHGGPGSIGEYREKTITFKMHYWTGLPNPSDTVHLSQADIDNVKGKRLRVIK